MDENAVVIMLKDKETGFLDKELGSYTLPDAEGLIFRIYAQEKNDQIVIVLKLTCEKELADWEYNAIFDYYDTEVLEPFASTIEEEEDNVNPVWVIEFPYSDSYEEMEELFTSIIDAHRAELASVYEAIADKKDDYFEE